MVSERADYLPLVYLPPRKRESSPSLDCISCSGNVHNAALVAACPCSSFPPVSFDLQMMSSAAVSSFSFDSYLPLFYSHDLLFCLMMERLAWLVK